MSLITKPLINALVDTLISRGSGSVSADHLLLAADALDELACQVHLDQRFADARHCKYLETRLRQACALIEAP